MPEVPVSGVIPWKERVLWSLCLGPVISLLCDLG